MLVELMTVGVPVVSTDYSDIRAILPYEWQVIAVRDPLQMADAIERAQQARESVVSVQRKWVEAHATIQTSADSLEASIGCISRPPSAVVRGGKMMNYQHHEQEAEPLFCCAQYLPGPRPA